MIDAVAIDWIRLLDHLDIDQCLVLGHLSGGVYGLHLAASFGARVWGLALLNYVPTWHGQRLSRLPARFRVIAHTTRYAPTMLPFIIRAGVAHVDAGHEDVFLRSFHGTVESDMRALRRPEVMKAVLDGLRHTVRQGGHAVALDCPMVLTDFTNIANNVSVPAEIILGADDQVVQVQDGRDVVNQVPHFRLNEIEGAGFFLLYTHWPQVFDVLERLYSTSESGSRLTISPIRRSA